MFTELRREEREWECPTTEALSPDRRGIEREREGGRGREEGEGREVEGVGERK